MSDAKIITDFIHYAEKLKTEMRFASKSDRSKESVADHCWRLSLMLLLVVPKLKIEIDLLKVLKMAIVHDLPEIEAKDVPILNSINNPEVKRVKAEQESRAIEKIKDMLGADGQEIYDLWHEYEKQGTNEAKLLKAIDMLEGQMQVVSEKVAVFDESQAEAIEKMFAKTAKACQIDPFVAELDRATLEGRRSRISCP